MDISEGNKALAIEFAEIFKSNLVVLLQNVDFIIDRVNSHKDVINEKVKGTGLSKSLLSICIAAVNSSKSFTDTNNHIGGLCCEFIDRSYMRWEEISRHEKEYLTENSHDIFGIDPRVPKEQIDEFSKSFLLKDLNGDLLLTITDLNLIWNLIDSIIIPSIKFIHYMRDPYIGENGKIKYNNSHFFNSIKMSEICKLYKVKGLKCK